MNDLIFRQDAIDSISAKLDESAKGDVGSFYNMILKKAIESVKSVPTTLDDKVRTLNDGTLVFTTESLDWFNRIVLEDGKMNKKEFYQNDDWIPCSERLPEEGKRVIVQYGDGSLGVIERVRHKIWNLINSPYAKVVAWMPAPEPWKGDNDEV